MRAADCPAVPLVHLIRVDRATAALDLYEEALRAADLSSEGVVERLAGLLDQTREAVSEFAKVPLGNAAVIDAAIGRGLWDEHLRVAHEQLVALLQRQAGA